MNMNANVIYMWMWIRMRIMNANVNAEANHKCKCSIHLQVHLELCGLGSIGLINKDGICVQHVFEMHVSGLGKVGSTILSTSANHQRQRPEPSLCQATQRWWWSKRFFLVKSTERKYVVGPMYFYQEVLGRKRVEKTNRENFFHLLDEGRSSREQAFKSNRYTTIRRSNP